MIRWFEVRGLEDPNEPPEYFGFMDTVYDRPICLSGSYFFSDRADFLECLQGALLIDHAMKERLKSLVPERIK